MLEAAGEVSQKVCKVGKIAVHTQDGSADLTPQERARLTAAIGNGKNQNVRCWTNAVGQALAIDDTVVDPKEGASAALVFSGCKGCTYTISATCAKVSFNCTCLIMLLVQLRSFSVVLSVLRLSTVYAEARAKR
jgi:hypothetical protein